MFKRIDFAACIFRVFQLGLAMGYLAQGSEVPTFITASQTGIIVLLLRALHILPASDGITSGSVEKTHGLDCEGHHVLFLGGLDRNTLVVDPCTCHPSIRGRKNPNRLKTEHPTENHLQVNGSVEPSIRHSLETTRRQWGKR